MTKIRFYTTKNKDINFKKYLKFAKLIPKKETLKKLLKSYEKLTKKFNTFQVVSLDLKKIEANIEFAFFIHALGIDKFFWNEKKYTEFKNLYYQIELENLNWNYLLKKSYQMENSLEFFEDSFFKKAAVMQQFIELSKKKKFFLFRKIFLVNTQNVFKNKNHFEYCLVIPKKKFNYKKFSFLNRYFLICFGKTGNFFYFKSFILLDQSQIKHQQKIQLIKNQAQKCKKIKFFWKN